MEPARRQRRAPAWERLLEAGLALLRTSSPVLPLAVIGLNLALSVFTSQVTLKGFPNSGDEYAYLISAQLFAEGRLSVPSPEPRQFFDVHHVINDGRFYGRYPPGWPLLLAAGVAAGAPWLVNPILGALALLVLHRLALRSFSRPAANAALLATAANPFLVLNSASYFSHPACLLAIAVATAAVLRCAEAPERRAPYLAMGAALGAAFLIRPFTAVVLGAVCVGWLLGSAVVARRLGSAAKGLAIALGPLLLGVAAFLAYDALQTGNPLLQPFLVYDAADRPLLLRWGWHTALATNTRALARLNVWIPLSLVFAGVAVVHRATRGDRRLVLPLSCVASLAVAYVFFHTGSGNEYGPRYLYETSVALFVLMGAAMPLFGRYAALPLLLVAALNVAGLADRSLHHAAQVRERMRLYDLVTERGLSDAIVFIRSAPDMHRADLTRNGIHFDAPVLYVLDLGDRNDELLRALPDRRGYLYVFDPATRRATLEPLRH